MAKELVPVLEMPDRPPMRPHPDLRASQQSVFRITDCPL